MPRVRPRQARASDYTDAELVAEFALAGCSRSDIARRINKLRGSTLTEVDIERIQIQSRATEVIEEIDRQALADKTLKADLERLDAIQSALYFKACGINPETMARDRSPSEQAARVVVEIIHARRELLGLDPQSQFIAGSAQFTFAAMTEKEVMDARAIAAADDVRDAEIAPATQAVAELPAPITVGTVDPDDVLLLRRV